MPEERWIDEQKKNRLFRGPVHSSDADRMLEISLVNKDTNRDQAMKIIVARFLGKNLGITCLDELSDAVEVAQLIVDRQSRQEFMKVAIDQWQGKVNANKNKAAEALKV